MRKELYFKRPIKKLRQILWDEISRYVRRRDDGICYTCGKKDDWKNMDAGHFVHASQQQYLLDIELNNLHCQCSRCNKYLSGNLGEYAVKMIREYGLEEVDRIRALKWQVYKPTKEEVIELIFKYKELNGNY